MISKKNIIYALLVLAVPLSYFFFDRPIVFFFAKHQTRQIAALHFFSDTVVSFLCFFIVLFWIMYCLWLHTINLSWIKKIKHCCLTPCLTAFIIHAIKPLFGRFWPDTFICNNLSLLKNNAYGFSGILPHSQNLSFPSGHAGFIVSISTALWYLFPKTRPFILLICSSVLLAQLTLYYHFLSDLIAGGLLGFVLTYRLIHQGHAAR